MPYPGDYDLSPYVRRDDESLPYMTIEEIEAARARLDALPERLVYAYGVGWLKMDDQTAADVAYLNGRTLHEALPPKLHPAEDLEPRSFVWYTYGGI